MKVKRIKKLLAAALSTAMVLTMLPTSALAEEVAVSEVEAEEVVEESEVEILQAEEAVEGETVDEEEAVVEEGAENTTTPVTKSTTYNFDGATQDSLGGTVGFLHEGWGTGASKIYWPGAYNEVNCNIKYDGALRFYTNHKLYIPVQDTTTKVVFKMTCSGDQDARRVWLIKEDAAAYADVVKSQYVVKMSKAEQSVVIPDILDYIVTVGDQKYLPMFSDGDVKVNSFVVEEYEPVNEVTVTGTITDAAAKGITTVRFIAEDIEKDIPATVAADGSFSAKLRRVAGNTTYVVAVESSDYMVKLDKNTFALTGNDAAVAVGAFDLVALEKANLSGKITGIDKELVKGDLKITFIPEKAGLFPIEAVVTPATEDYTYTVALISGQNYSVKMTNADDYEYKTIINETDATATKDLAIVKKPLYTVSGKYVTSDRKKAPNATLTFTNNDTPDYKYTVDVVDGKYSIKLRDGDYTTSGDVAGYEVFDHVLVNGKDSTNDIYLIAKDGPMVYTYDKIPTLGTGSIKVETGKPHTVATSGDTVTIPVSGASNVAITYYYAAAFKIGDTAYTTVESTGSTSKSDTLTISTDSDVVINFTGKTYITEISVTPTVAGPVKYTYDKIPALGTGSIKVESGKTHTVATSGDTVTIPVNGESKVSINYYYAAAFTIGDTAYTTVESTGSTSKSDTLEITVDSNVVIKFTGTTYLLNIEVIPEAGDVDNFVSELTIPGDCDSINEAMAIIAEMNRPEGEAGRVTLDLKKDIFEQTIVNQPYITIKGNDHTIAWYYGQGTLYYSEDKNGKLYSEKLAVDRYASAEGDGTYWGGAFIARGNHFIAENTTFKNTYNFEVTEAEKSDIAGQAGAIKDSRLAADANVEEYKYKERSNAFYVEADELELYNCKVLSSQDGFGRNGDANNHYKVYVKDSLICGNVDYICGEFTAVFDNCELQWKTYVNDTAGKNSGVGYITAAKSNPYVFRNCKVTTDGKEGNSTVVGMLGRTWYGEKTEGPSNVTFINLETNGLIDSTAWGQMNGEVEKAKFNTFNVTSNGYAFTPSNGNNNDFEAVKAYFDTETSNGALGNWTPSKYTKVTADDIISGKTTITIDNSSEDVTAVVKDATVSANGAYIVDKNSTATLQITASKAGNVRVNNGTDTAVKAGETITAEIKVAYSPVLVRVTFVADEPEKNDDGKDDGEKPAPITPSGNVIPDKPAQPDDKPAKPVVPGGATVIGADGKPFVLTEAQAATVATDYAKIAGKLASKGNDTIKVISAITDKGQLEITYKKGKPAKIVATSLDGVSKVFDVTVNAGTKIVVPGTKADPGTATPSEAVKVKAKYNKKADGVVIATKNSKSVPTYDVVYTNDTNGYKITVHVVCVNINKNYKKYTLSSADKDSVTVTPVNGGILTGTWTVGKTVIKSVNEQQNVQISKKLKADIVVNPNGTITIINPSGKGAIKLTYTINGKKYNTSVKVVDKPLNDKQKSNNELPKK